MKIDSIPAYIIVGNAPEEIAIIAASEGLWLCVDEKMPQGLVPIIATNGKLYAIQQAQELRLDGFYPSASFCGPFTPEDVSKITKGKASEKNEK